MRKKKKPIINDGSLFHLPNKGVKNVLQNMPRLPKKKTLQLRSIQMPKRSSSVGMFPLRKRRLKEKKNDTNNNPVQ